MAMARFDERVNLGFSEMDMGAPIRSYAQEVKQFAQNLGQNVEGIRTSARSIQATQGAKEAQADILKGGKPTYKEGGFFDKAYAESYNKLMRDAYVASLSMDSQLELQNIYDKYKGDQKGFTGALDAYKKGLMAELDPDTAGQFLPKFDTIAQSVRLKVNQDEISTNRVNALNIIEQAAEASAKNTLIAVKEGTGNDILNTSAQFVEHVQKLREADPIKYNDKVISDLMDKHSKAMANEGFYRDFDESLSEGLEAGFAKYQELSAKTPKGYTPEEWENVTGRMLQKLNAIESQRKATQTASKSMVSYQIGQYEKAMNEGGNISDADIDSLISQAYATGDEVLYAKALQLKSVNFYMTAPTSYLKEIRDKSGTLKPNEIPAYNKAMQALQNHETEINKDPVAFGIKQNLIPAEPIDLSTPEGVRTAQERALKVQAQYDLAEPPAPYTEPELKLLADKIDSADSIGKIQLVTDIAKLGDIKWPVLEKVAGKGAGVFAMAAATDDANVQSAIFKGQDVIKAGVVKLPKDDDFRQDFDTYVGNAYGVEDSGLIFEAAKAHYAATAPVDGTFNQKLWKESLRQVTGGIGERKGFKYELPRGVDESDFEDYVTSFDDKTLAHFGGVNVPVEDAYNLFNNGIIMSEGGGRYSVMDKNGFALQNAKGEKFIFSYDINAPRGQGKSSTMKTIEGAALDVFLKRGD